jgi:hypothetical protein
MFSNDDKTDIIKLYFVERGTFLSELKIDKAEVKFMFYVHYDNVIGIEIAL